jgi:SAM-dependent methyltransferase
VAVVEGVPDRERFLRTFHGAHPGITSAALARGVSYRRLADCVVAGQRLLDLGCGDGHLLALLAGRGCRPIGLDVSLAELAGTARARACARAQALPFAAGSFDAVVSHLVFMLLDEIEAVVGELGRVLVPGGSFHAVLGGGPTADGDDAFHRFLAVGRGVLAAMPGAGDPRAKSEAGWRALFAGWEVGFERVEVDLGGSFEDVWRFLGASYELAAGDVAAVRAATEVAVADLVDGEGRVPCRIVMWLANARAPGRGPGLRR